MRDETSKALEALTGDRRVRRSRAALTSAMTELTLERGYSGLEPKAVAKRADVGRSTFYTHFAGMDDLLAHSLEKHLSTLAECTLKADLDPALVSLMKHFWQQRGVSRAILHGTAIAAISRVLRSKLEAGLLELRRSQKLQVDQSVSLIAAHISAGQLAALDTWLSGRAPATHDQMARLLQTVSYASACATCSG